MLPGMGVPEPGALPGSHPMLPPSMQATGFPTGGGWNQLSQDMVNLFLAGGAGRTLTTGRPGFPVNLPAYNQFAGGVSMGPSAIASPTVPDPYTRALVEQYLSAGGQWPSFQNEDEEY